MVIGSTSGLLCCCHLGKCAGSRKGTIMGMNTSLSTSVDGITIDPAICHGKPIIRGMRWPVQNLLELLTGGMTADEIISDHPELEREDIQAALEFAARKHSETAGPSAVI